MEGQHQVRLRLASDGSSWTFRWDDSTARLFTPAGDTAFELPSATVGVWADHRALLLDRRIVLRVHRFGRLSSAADATAADQFLRAIYPLFVADQRQEQAIQEYRRGRTWLLSVVEWPLYVSRMLGPEHRHRRAIS